MNDFKENLKKDTNFLGMENLFCLRSHQNMYRNYRVALFQPPANNFLNLGKLST